jgi:hypothetical protein
MDVIELGKSLAVIIGGSVALVTFLLSFCEYKRQGAQKKAEYFLGFFEEVALMMNSGLIRKEVAHYMFGYYAIHCWDSKNFW